MPPPQHGQQRGSRSRSRRRRSSSRKRDRERRPETSEGRPHKPHKHKRVKNSKRGEKTSADSAPKPSRPNSPGVAPTARQKEVIQRVRAKMRAKAHAKAADKAAAEAALLRERIPRGPPRFAAKRSQPTSSCSSQVPLRQPGQKPKTPTTSSRSAIDPCLGPRAQRHRQHIQTVADRIRRKTRHNSEDDKKDPAEHPKWPWARASKSKSAPADTKTSEAEVEMSDEEGSYEDFDEGLEETTLPAKSDPYCVVDQPEEPQGPEQQKTEAEATSEAEGKADASDKKAATESQQAAEAEGSGDEEASVEVTVESSRTPSPRTSPSPSATGAVPGAVVKAKQRPKPTTVPLLATTAKVVSKAVQQKPVLQKRRSCARRKVRRQVCRQCTACPVGPVVRQWCMVRKCQSSRCSLTPTMGERAARGRSPSRSQWSDLH